MEDGRELSLPAPAESRRRTAENNSENSVRTRWTERKIPSMDSRINDIF
jgi:hypothetical protein